MSRKEFQGTTTCVGAICGGFATLQNYSPEARSGPQAPVATISPIGEGMMRVPQFGSVAYVSSIPPANGGYTTITQAYPGNESCMTSYMTKACK